MKLCALALIALAVARLGAPQPRLHSALIEHFRRAGDQVTAHHRGIPSHQRARTGSTWRGGVSAGDHGTGAAPRDCAVAAWGCLIRWPLTHVA